MITRLLIALFILLFSATAVTAQIRRTPTPTPGTSDETPSLTGIFTDDSGTVSDWETVVEELQSLELIEGEGELLFTNEMSLEAFGEAGFAETPYVNYIMGALISVRELPDGMPGVCTFITRGITDAQGQMDQAVGVVFTSFDEIYALEFVGGRSAPRETMATFPIEGNDSLYSPQYALVLVNEETLTVWVNGDVYIDMWELENPIPDGDTYEEDVVTTINPESGCVMTGVWAYGF